MVINIKPWLATDLTVDLTIDLMEANQIDYEQNVQSDPCPPITGTDHSHNGFGQNSLPDWPTTKLWSVIARPSGGSVKASAFVADDLCSIPLSGYKPVTLVTLDTCWCYDMSLPANSSPHWSLGIECRSTRPKVIASWFAQW